MSEHKEQIYSWKDNLIGSLVTGLGVLLLQIIVGWGITGKLIFMDFYFRLAILFSVVLFVWTTVFPIEKEKK